MSSAFSSKTRLEHTFLGLERDRTPILGGWIACPEHICAVTGASIDEYWEDSVSVTIRAYEMLNTDGLIDIYVPKNKEDFRAVDVHSYQRSDIGVLLEDTLEEIERMPSPEEMEENFDFDSEYAAFKSNQLDMQKRCGDMLYMPAQWQAGAKVGWYANFGYENFFLIVGLYEKHARKLLEIGGMRGRLHSRLVARAVKEGIFPHAVFLGEDICTQRGPMISPDFLEKYYAPQLKYSLEPLLEAGCKPVWHCDGDVRSILDMLIDSGVQGLQGFQPECGMTIESIAERKTRDGKPLLIFGPISVTTELPVLSPAAIKLRVRRAIDVCRGKADLVLFTSNTINPDIPLKNIIAMYEAVLG